MLAGVFIILALLMRLFSHLYTSVESGGYEPREPAENEKSLTIERPKGKLDLSRSASSLNGNVFDNLEKNYAKRGPKAEPLKLDKVPYHSYNPIQGDDASKVKVTLFLDTSCATCRIEAKRFISSLGALKQKVMLVYKFMPMDKKESSGGIFDQIAWRSDKFDAYIDTLLTSTQPMETDEYMALLERVGVPLSKQQSVMKYSMQDIVSLNQQDIVLAQDLGLYKLKQNPVVYLNGYRLGQMMLPKSDVQKYIQRLLNGDPIL